MSRLLVELPARSLQLYLVPCAWGRKARALKYCGKHQIPYRMIMRRQNTVLYRATICRISFTDTIPRISFTAPFIHFASGVTEKRESKTYDDGSRVAQTPNIFVITASPSSVEAPP